MASSNCLLKRNTLSLFLSATFLIGLLRTLQGVVLLLVTQKEELCAIERLLVFGHRKARWPFGFRQLRGCRHELQDEEEQ